MMTAENPFSQVSLRPSVVVLSQCLKITLKVSFYYISYIWEPNLAKISLFSKQMRAQFGKNELIIKEL